MPARKLTVSPMRPARSAGHAAQRGLTFIELIISIVIISISVVGVLGVMSQTTGRSADPMIQTQAIAIGEAYLEEILLKPYLDPDTGTVCPAKEGARALYDNVCDYQGLDDNGARDQTGAAISGLDDYRVQASIDTGASLNGLSGSGQLLRIEVRVTHGSLVDTTLASYRTNY